MTKDATIAMLRQVLPQRFPDEAVEIESIDPHHPALEVAGMFPGVGCLMLWILDTDHMPHWQRSHPAAISSADLDTLK